MRKKKLLRWANAYLERQTVDGMDLPRFKITFGDTKASEEGLRFSVVPAGRFNGKIFEALQTIYIDAGMSKQEATVRANQVVVDFYKGADKVTREGGRPFKVYITKTDEEKYKNTLKDL